MAAIMGKHVQLVLSISQLNNNCGILQLSELGAEYIKLEPWPDDYAISHAPWITVKGEVHILRSLVQAVINIDTIDGKAIENYTKSLAGNDAGATDYERFRSKD